MENKIIKKLSFQMFIISGTLLGGYVVSNNPLISNEMAVLTTTYFVSGLTYVKVKK